MEQIQTIINEANLAGMTELERMDAQHAENGKIRSWHGRVKVSI